MRMQRKGSEMSEVRITPAGSMEAINGNGAWQSVPKAAADRIEALEAALAKADALADQCELFANGKLYSMNPVLEAREAYREARK